MKNGSGEANPIRQALALAVKEEEPIHTYKLPGPDGSGFKTRWIGLGKEKALLAS